jgi:hypothetical protein
MILAVSLAVAIPGAIIVSMDTGEFLNYAMWTGIVVIGICAVIPVVMYIAWVSRPRKRRRRRPAT